MRYLVEGRATRKRRQRMPRRNKRPRAPPVGDLGWEEASAVLQSTWVLGEQRRAAAAKENRRKIGLSRLSASANATAADRCRLLRRDRDREGSFKELCDLRAPMARNRPCASSHPHTPSAYFRCLSASKSQLFCLMLLSRRAAWQCSPTLIHPSSHAMRCALSCLVAPGRAHAAAVYTAARHVLTGCHTGLQPAQGLRPSASSIQRPHLEAHSVLEKRRAGITSLGLM